MKLNVNNYLVARIIAHGIISGLLKLTQRQWRAKSRSYIIFGDSVFMHCNCPTQVETGGAGDDTQVYCNSRCSSCSK